MSHHWTAGLLFVHIAAKWRSEKLIPIVPIRNTDCYGETALPLRAGIYGTAAAVDATEMETHHKILILDDDADWLDLCRELLVPLASKPEIRTVSSGARALALLESEPFRLVVCDLKMPRMDGLQVLAIVRRRFPQLRTVVLSGLEDEEFRSRAYALGVDLFWLKADMQQNTQMFLDCLESLLGREVDGGFRGIQRKSLMDIIQMECLSRSSTVLRISRGPLTAKMWIQDGEVIDAETEGTRGEPAVRRILAWKSGTFESLPAESGRERTITKPINALLLESAQTIDESANVSEPESMEQDVHRKTVWKLGLLMREGAEFVVSVPQDGQGVPEALGTQSTAQFADWTRLVADVTKRLGERIEAGPLSHVAATGVDRQLLVFPSERKSFLVGWPPGDAAGEILEKSKRLVVSWDS
jgi:CheY-like chemotaxis protein